jgi:hypothetical protein
MAYAFRDFQEPERDIQQQMIELIRESIPEGSGWMPAVVAEDIVANLRQNDPELLHLWLQDSAPRFIQQHLVRILAALRAKTKSEVAARAFGEAATRFTAGDRDALSMFELTYAMEDGTQVTIADMTGKDHLYIAGRFAMEAKQYALLEQFHKAVAKKVGNKKTSEVFTAEKYEQMYRSIVNL